MKKQLLLSITLLSTLHTLSAGIIENTFNTAGNLTEDALEVPGDVLYGRDRHNQEDSTRRHGLFRRHYDDYR